MSGTSRRSGDDDLPDLGDALRAYRRDARDLPSRDIDDAIRAAARRAVRSGPRASTDRGGAEPRQSLARWPAWFAVAATVVLASAVALRTLKSRDAEFAPDMSSSTKARPAGPGVVAALDAPKIPAPSADGVAASRSAGDAASGAAAQASAPAPAPAEAYRGAPSQVTGVPREVTPDRIRERRDEPPSRPVIEAKRETIPESNADRAPPSKFEGPVPSASERSREPPAVAPAAGKAAAAAQSASVAQSAPAATAPTSIPETAADALASHVESVPPGDRAVANRVDARSRAPEWPAQPDVAGQFVPDAAPGHVESKAERADTASAPNSVPDSQSDVRNAVSARRIPSRSTVAGAAGTGPDSAALASPAAPPAAAAAPSAAGAPARAAEAASERAGGEAESGATVADRTAEPAPRWIERIRALRRDGKIDMASKELERFKRAYPDYPLAESDR